MKKVLFIESHDLKCDAPGCDYKEPAAYPPPESLVGKLCPKCGADMLTREDYEKTKEVFQAIEAINKVADALGVGAKKMTGKGQLIAVNPHGDDLNITIRDEK